MLVKFVCLLSLLFVFAFCGSSNNNNSHNGDYRDTAHLISAEEKQNDLSEPVYQIKKGFGIAQELKESTQPLKAKPLKEVFKNYFAIGTAVSPSWLKNKKVADFISEQYNSITAVNEMKPNFIHPRQNEYRWTEADSIVHFAQNHNMKVRGHCLIWFYRMPSWFLYQDNKLVTKAVLFKRIKEHINAVMGRYKGKVYCYDVLNEIVPKGQGNNLFNKIDTLYKIGGFDYIKYAFQCAREADPTAKLYYNDAFNDKAKRDKIYAFLKLLKENNVPVDGVGIQCHLGIDGISTSLLDETIKLFSGLGLDVQITELDVSIFEKTATKQLLKNSNDAFTNVLEEKQANIYKNIFAVLRQNKSVVKGVTMWAPADINSYLTKLLGKKNYPYIFDKNLQPKRAYYAITQFSN